MEILTRTATGTQVRLTVELDRHSIHQVYAYFIPSGEEVEKKFLCNCWGRRKASDGIREGIVLSGHILEVSRADWLKVFFAREDLHARENLKYIHLVRIFSHGNRLKIDGYTLSARVDRETWKRISPFMEEVDSSVNEVLHEGDHFVGWIVKAGMERQVEETIGVSAENSIFAEETEYSEK